MNAEFPDSISINPDAHRESDARLDLLYEIGRILASLETMNEAAPQILEAICLKLDFALGELWCKNKQDKILRLENVWFYNSPALERFVGESRQFEFTQGKGLPGKVWAKGAPVWIEKFKNDDNIPRKSLVENAGLQSGFAFPILLGEKLLGVFSFFSTKTRLADDALLQMFSAIGNHIGQFIKREKIESDLRESEDRYRAFITQSTEGIWRFELEKKIPVSLPTEKQLALAFQHAYLAECNDAMAQMYGLEKAEELVGKRISDLLDMNDAANVEYIRAFIESGYNLIDAESHEKDVAGNDKYFLNSLVGLIIEGNLIRVWGTQRDITKQKRAEQSLRESEERFAKAFNASPLALTISSLETGKIIEVNETFINIAGYSREETIGRTTVELGLWVNAPDREKELSVVREFSQIRNVEYLFRIKTGEEIVGLLSAERIELNGESFALTVIQDVTARKRANETLLERERLARLNSEISETLIQNDLLPDILRRCTEIVVRHLDAAVVRIWTLNKAEQILELQSSSGDYTQLDSEHSRVPVGKHKIGWIAADRKPHLTNSVIGDSHISSQKWAKRENIVAFAGYPLIVEDRLVGVVAMYSRQELSEHTLETLSSIANTLALGIERKQSEIAVRESEANFRQLAEAVPQFVWVTEADGSLSYVNEQWIEFSGLNLERTNDSLSAAEIFHPEDVKRLALEWEKSLKNGVFFEIELRMKNARGEYRWFLTRSRPVKNADGKILKWFGTSTDITEGKQAEIRLSLLAEISEMTRASENPEELLFLVSKSLGEHFEARRCLFNEIDLENDCETVHRDYCRGVESVAGVHRLSDYSSITSADMAAGKTVVNNDSKTDSRTASDYEKTYEPNGERAYITVPLLRENRWVASLWLSIDVPREWSRQEISLLETIAERTWTAMEKLRIDAALRESQEVLSLAMSSSRMGAWSRDLLTEKVYWSAELEELFGLRTGTFAGNIDGFYDYIYDEDKDYLGREVQKALSEKRDYVVEFRFYHADGSLGWMEGRGQGIYAADGQPIKAYGIGIDITERKQAEVERERLLISEQQARETAERANHSKDEFIALVSHELRSPLNAMLGWTRILQKQKADEKTTAYALDVIVRNARAQSKLIEDLLDIARVGESKLRLEMKPTELVEIISAAVEIIKPAADLKNIKLTESSDRTASFITGDDDRLRQVVENLLSNALKFTSEGGSVDVRLERRDQMAELSISDTGQGISAEFLPQIFERFIQADPSTTRRHGGLGIGLSLARDLVELHGGTIAADSAGEGKGSTFTVQLPLRMVAPIKENTNGKRESMNAQGKLSGFWILAVDDEADAREIVSFMLQMNGAQVTSANSAVEALEILKGAQGRLPDVLLSDISMPNESGYALLEKVRALPAENGGQIPAVALTAFNRPEDRQSAFEAGFQKHLGKPVEMEDLIAAIIETANGKH